MAETRESPTPQQKRKNILFLCNIAVDNFTVKERHMPKYFAYGSNLYQPQMKDRCASTTLVARVSLPGYVLSFPRISKMWNHCGVASIEREEGAVTYGVVYDISDDDLVLMDGFEGTDIGSYTRKPVTVFTDDRSKTAIECWTYFATPQDGKPFFPSPAYLTAIIKGAEMHGIPPDYIKDLKKWKKS